MPYDEPDITDPNMLVGVMLPGEPETVREMAYVFAEEFARLGYERAMILSLFRSPAYGGAHGAFVALGEEVVAGIVDECLAVWGRVRFVDRIAPADPVLERHEAELLAAGLAEEEDHGEARDCGLPRLPIGE